MGKLTILWENYVHDGLFDSFAGVFTTNYGKIQLSLWNVHKDDGVLAGCIYDVSMITISDKY